VSDKKAKDILDTLPVRRRAGELTHDRVGRRRTEGPGGERRRKIFDRLGVADPYNPDAKDRPLALGPVALKLTDRRQPAPHARVRDPKKKKSASHDPGAFKPNVPSAPRARPTPRPTPKAPPKPAAAPPPVSDKPPPGPKGAPRLPVRPDIAEATGAPAPARRAAPTRPAHATQDKKKAGRYRLRRTDAHGPKERKVENNTSPLVEKTEEAVEAPKRTAGPAGNSAGLDDLFGFSGEGRMRRPKKDE
jgi:hypothetical protein